MSAFLEIAPNTGQMVLKRFEELTYLPPDPEMEARIKSLNDRHCFDQVLFQLPPVFDFSYRNLKKQSTPLGRFLCQTMARAAGAALAFHGSGTIRAGLWPGPVTRADIFDLMPFTTDLIKVRLSGRDIWNIVAGNLTRSGSAFNFTA